MKLLNTNIKIILLIIIEINLIISVASALKHKSHYNQRPIIGILTQQLSHHLKQVYPDLKYKSYIAASYVKFIESAGARVVPIWTGRNKSYYNKILNKINGVIFPGGSAFFNETNGYADAGIHIYNIAKEMNKQNDFFPIMGICLGFELLTYAASGAKDHRIRCSSHNQLLSLKFEPGFEKSKLFCDASSDIIDILRDEDVTINFHRYCVTKKGLKKVNIDKEFKILSLNKDRNGSEFISSLEHKELPFYGLQFHPEKNNYEWAPRFHIAHGINAIRASQFFSNKFVEEARKNNHSFPSTRDEENHLIYNYPTYYTGPTNSSFEQCYLFEK